MFGAAAAVTTSLRRWRRLEAMMPSTVVHSDARRVAIVAARSLSHDKDWEDEATKRAGVPEAAKGAAAATWWALGTTQVRCCCW